MITTPGSLGISNISGAPPFHHTKRIASKNYQKNVRRGAQTAYGATIFRIADATCGFAATAEMPRALPTPLRACDGTVPRRGAVELSQGAR